MTPHQEEQIIDLFRRGLLGAGLTQEQTEIVLKKTALVQDTVEQFMQDVTAPTICSGPAIPVAMRTTDQNGEFIETVNYVRNWPEQLLRPRPRKGYYRKGL